MTDVQDPNLHLLAVGEGYYNFGFAHGPHTNYPRQWNSTLTGLWSGVEDKLSEYDGVIALTPSQRADLSKRWGDRNNFFVIPHAVPPVTGEVHLTERKKNRALVVARLSREKRLDDAIRAFALVVANVPDAVLDISGDGPDRADLEQLAQNLGMSANVIFHGHNGAAKDAAQSASVFIMTSKYEGQPMALLEALARGCPAVAYDVKYEPGDTISHGLSGFLVKDEELRGMSARIQELFASDALRDEMSDRARQQSASFGPSHFVGGWLAALQDAIDSRPARTELADVDFSVRAQSTNVVRLSRPLDGVQSLTDHENFIDGYLTVQGDVPAAARSEHAPRSASYATQHMSFMRRILKAWSRWVNLVSSRLPIVPRNWRRIVCGCAGDPGRS